jgi:Ser/Thr protein kinase RdoA (MazF antagonist)
MYKEWQLGKFRYPQPEHQEDPRLCLHFVSGYEYCCEIDESEIPNT